MADAIELYLDLSTPQGALVKGLSDRSAAVLGPFYQGSALNLRVFPVVSNGRTVAGPFFDRVALDNLDFELVLGPRAGATAILAAQYVWAKQSAADTEGKSGYFYATLDLNTTEMNTAMASEDTLTRHLEFRLKRTGGVFGPVCQVSVQIIAAVKDPSGAASIPTPAPSYLTRDECLALFVQWNNAIVPANAGRNVILLSPDGTRTRELGVANDASPIDNAT